MRNQNSIFTTLGASNHALEEREQHDYYATDPKAVELLLELEPFAPVVETCWELSPEELAVVQQTGKVYLSIVGGQPPVCLSVVSLQEP